MSRSDQLPDRMYQRVPMKWAAMAAAFVASTSGWAHAQPVATGDQAEAAPEVVLEADQITSDDKAGLITAEGNVEARYENRTLRAEKLIYDTKKHTVHAVGRVEILDDNGTVRFADEIEVDDKLNAGVATGFSSRIAGGGTLAAASMVRLPSGVEELNRVVYTACPVCTNGSPTWQLRARKAVRNPNTDMISYRDVVLQVHDVPVLWLPYFSHPDPTAGRKSGFLLPDAGHTRRFGTFYAQPYYWAISDYSELTIEPRVMSNVNPLLLVRYHKRFWSGDLQVNGSATYEKNFDNDGNRFGDATTRSHIFATGNFDIDDYWKWSFGAARTSDDLYLRRYDIPANNSQAALYLSDLTRLFSHLDVTGQDAHSYTNVAFYSVQGLRADDNSTTLPLVLPVGEVRRNWRDPWLQGQLEIQASTANLVRNDGVDSSRVTVGGQWDVERIFGPGLMLNPFAQARGDVYRVDDFTTSKPVYVSRLLGIGGAELRWPFVRASSSGVSYLVEPIIMAAVASNEGNDPRIPDEDSQSIELDDSGLFRPTGVSGYDLWQPGPRLSAGFRASAVNSVGTATAEFGRQWRGKSDPNFAPITNLDGKASDWVGSVSADAGMHFGGTMRVRLDDTSLRVNRFDASLHGKLGIVSGAVRYFDLNKRIISASPTSTPAQEVAGSVGLQVTKSWNLSYGLRRDLDSAINLSQDIGVTYRNSCAFVEFVYSHAETSDRSVGPSEGFQLRIGLSTLGVFGGSG